uniref:Uncharacterized protein n=1 Tax=Kalanchoe fedtschenkoi TaxID=63787 RepID=A0A7N0T8I6_KALFE
MGCGMSSNQKPSSSSWDNNKAKKSNVRVVHLDGRVEDYEVPVKVNQIILNPKKDLLCTKSQLLCTTGSSKALSSDCELELGNLYFLLPISAFRCEASVMDMANMVNKLTNIAKSARLKEGSRPVPVGGSGLNRVAGGKGSGSVEKCVWKPVLDAIGEKSSNGRSESDLLRY